MCGTSELHTLGMKALARSYLWWLGLDKELERCAQECLSSGISLALKYIAARSTYAAMPSSSGWKGCSCSVPASANLLAGVQRIS